MSECWRRRRVGLAVSVTAVALLIAAVAVAYAQADPSGAATGGIQDVPAAVPGAPTLQEVAALAGHNRVAINMVWTLVTGFLVMFMQAGFALVETGFTRAKNASHTMLMNFLIYAIGMLGYWLVGFGLQMGGTGGAGTLGGATGLDGEFTVRLFGKEFGLFGTKGFLLTGAAYDAAAFALFLFQMVFMDTAATIPTGAMAERWKFWPFVVYGFFISMVTYPLFANWVWGGGWLSALGRNFGLGHGYLDFAGSSVVHMTGGVTALAGALVLGPRIGKFKADGTPVAIPGHNIPMAILGTFILAFGWFGFNAGSTLAGGDLRIGVIATNTMLASAAGALAAALYTAMRYGKPDTSMAANGMLAGLVAITAPCAFVNAPAAVLIGLVAGILVVWSVDFVEKVLKVDDPVGAISVHGTNGAWGVLALGLFADGTYGDGLNGIAGGVRGLLYGDAGQLLAQIIGPLVNFVFIFALSWLFFKALDVVMGMRVSREAELEGLDFHEVAVPGYPEVTPPALPEVARPAAVPLAGGK
ncbi:MAG: ammonium transporter [Limnochordaceae bacterium]|nr:ammonium transporter [Limnochordaceae bacterium]